MNEMIRDISVPNNWGRSGLPGWCYHSPALLELEKQHVFREHWQIACHVSDIPEPGNYLAMDVIGERALILRGRRAPAATPSSVPSTAGSTISTARCAAPRARRAFPRSTRTNSP